MLKIIFFQFYFILNLILTCKCQIPEVSQDQAMQMASKMKACVPVKPGANLGNFKDKLVGQWFVSKLYDAPMEEDHPMPPFEFSKHPGSGQIILGGDFQRK
jgi:hypothetical protein